LTAAWDDELAELRAVYLREAHGRIDELDRALDLLDGDGSDARALQDLRRGFHAFTGSGATYGLPAVSALGLEAERQCTAVGSGPAVASDLESWRAAVNGLRREIAAADPQAAPAVEAVSAVERPLPSVPRTSRRMRWSGRRSCARSRQGEARFARAAAGPEGALEALGRHLPDAPHRRRRRRPGRRLRLVERLRARRREATVLSSCRRPSRRRPDRVEPHPLRADGHFTKPTDVVALVRRLRFLLDREGAEAPRILSVEDDPQQAAFLRTVLGSAGYEFRTVEDPARLEAELAAFRPDLVLMDVLLPGVSGYDLVRSLRQDERHATLPVIVLTTQGELDSRIEAARAGGDEHLVKPVSPALLLSTVAARVERGRFLRLLVERDGLTGLLTHTALLERARVVITKKRRDPTLQASCIMIDLDRFKAVNDDHGHPTGDQVLVRLAGLLRVRLRQADVVGRYGGEEFAVVLEDLTAEEATRLVERLRTDFAGIEHRSREGAAFRVTFSAGLAGLQDGESVSAWVHAADRALYAAKEGGRNRVVVASSGGDAAMGRRCVVRVASRRFRARPLPKRPQVLG
jgi:diguanylate cyclase (GGDEF)-like protein